MRATTPNPTRPSHNRCLMALRAGDASQKRTKATPPFCRADWRGAGAPAWHRCEVPIRSGQGGVEPGQAGQAGPRAFGLAALGPLAELLGQSDDDPLGAADETEPVAVLVLRQLAEEFGAVGAQAGDDVLDVVDGEHDATDAQRVRRCVVRFTADRRRRVELRQLDPPVAVRDPHHDDVGTDAVESDGAVNRISLDERLALQLHTKL